MYVIKTSKGSYYAGINQPGEERCQFLRPDPKPSWTKDKQKAEQFERFEDASNTLLGLSRTSGPQILPFDTA